MKDLFDATTEEDRKRRAPLAERMRPQSFEEVVGQSSLIAPGKPLRAMIEQDCVSSMIFWGPPGCGKTTIAKLVAQFTSSTWIELSAVSIGVPELRAIIKEAEERFKFHRKKTLVFLDELHRFNKAQQDALLPHVERGTIQLIGATTENPSFEINSALLSRSKVFVFEKISSEDVKSAVKRALTDVQRGLGSMHVQCEEEVLNLLVSASDGDVRHALTVLELVVQSTPMVGGTRTLSREQLADVLQRSHQMYDRNGEEHYNIISALHKSMRGSDANASLYWLARMLAGGEDPMYIARRLIRFASEDIGMKDPGALTQAVSAYQACHMIGMPECSVVLAQAVVYLSEAPKSNALYEAIGQAMADAKEHAQEPVPLHLRNAPTALMRELGYGKGYQYPPTATEELNQLYLPESLADRVYWKHGPRKVN